MNTFVSIKQRTQQQRAVVRTKAEKADRREQVKKAEKVAELTDDTITQEVVDAQKKTSASIGSLVSLITKSTGREQDIEAAIEMAEEHIKTAEDIQLAAEEVAKLQNFQKAQFAQTEIQQKEDMSALFSDSEEDKAEWADDDAKFEDRIRRDKEELAEARKVSTATQTYDEERSGGHRTDAHNLAKRRIEADAARAEELNSVNFKRRKDIVKDSGKEIAKMEAEIETAEKAAAIEAKTSAKEAGTRTKAQCAENATLLAAQNTAAQARLTLRLEIAKGNVLREQKRGQDLQTALKEALGEGNTLAKAAVQVTVPKGGA